LYLIPEWVFERMGIDPGFLSTAGLATPLPSAFGGQNRRICGELKIGFENMPSNARVREVRSNSADFGINVDAGYAMVGR
jgi:hypothetical protein